MLSQKHSPAKTPLPKSNKVNGYGALRSSRAARQSPAKSSEAVHSPANVRPYGLEESVSRSLTRTTAAFDRGELSNWRIFLCSLSLAGVQFTCGFASRRGTGTVEFAYGSPYLLDLGLSKPLMSLVWLAGPLVTGCSAYWRLQRPPSKPFGPQAPLHAGRCSNGGRVTDGHRVRAAARFLSGRRRFRHAGAPSTERRRGSRMDWASIRASPPPQPTLTGGVPTPQTRHAASMLAVVGFYILDFSLNTVQASCRALILDSAPAHQQGLANSWASRMINVGNVFGYFVGFLDLPQLLPFLGDGQVSVLCSVASMCVRGNVASYFLRCASWSAARGELNTDAKLSDTCPMPASCPLPS
ncbi:MAG: hypothetical protein BJ554DRAFT_5654 [Olpidium bornovanus]|uniref:Uncharacterized protein n=1 Tax=Olpidium bornovanus TaxID=278681 RepID=A0A8H7ZZ62_9FUNG|nr:MAG: hypothetical protein BJ554DRAFT_5654 [Olpidium bornovanus]